MKQIKCNACVNQLPLMASMKGFSFGHVICPFCNHANKIKFSFMSMLYGCMSGFLFGVFTSTIESDGVSTYTRLLLIGLSFMLGRMSLKHRIDSIVRPA